MKKIISIILVIVMAITISMPVYAGTVSTKDFNHNTDANGTVGGEAHSSVVKYGVAGGFVMEIPSDITFLDTANGDYVTEDIVARNYVLKTGQRLVVTVSTEQKESNGDWYMKEEATGVKLKYWMKLSNETSTVVKSGGEVFSVSPMETGDDPTVPGTNNLYKKQTLHCYRNLTNQAGKYRDLLTFNTFIDE